MAKQRVPLGKPLDDQKQIENYTVTPDAIADAEAWAAGLNQPQQYVDEKDKLRKVSPGFAKGLLKAKKK